MGQPVKIVDLAERMIRLSGLEPGRDIDITFTGIRPGERLHEILFAREEPTADIGIAGVVAAQPVPPSIDTMRPGLRRWSRALVREDRRRSIACCATRCRTSRARRPDQSLFEGYGIFARWGVISVDRRSND